MLSYKNPTLQLKQNSNLGQICHLKTNNYVRDGGGRIVNDLLSQQSVPQKRLI